jgi:hypothetical protein
MWLGNIWMGSAGVVIDDLPISRVEWQPCWLLVTSRFPPIGLFDRVADPDDLDIVYTIESLTSDQLLDEVGNKHSLSLKTGFLK